MPANHLETKINKEQDELIGKYIAEFALENDLKIHDEDILKAIELFDESSPHWQSNLNTSITGIAKDLDFEEIDKNIVEMVSVVWKKSTRR